MRNFLKLAPMPPAPLLTKSRSGEGRKPMTFAQHDEQDCGNGSEPHSWGVVDSPVIHRRGVEAVTRRAVFQR